MIADGSTLGFIGAGRVGTALSLKLEEAGYHVAAVYDRDPSAARLLADSLKTCSPVPTAQGAAEGNCLVFITTGDDQIGPVCDSVAWARTQAVVHCSGAVSTDILASAAMHGAQVGSFHPCQAFTDATQALKNIPGSTFAIEGEPPLALMLETMAAAMGCGHFRIAPGDKPLYHVAAVFVSNYAVTLLKAAADLFSGMGISTERAVEILMPLVRGNVANMEQAGLPDCLTGPIARGDSGTVEKHLDALQERFPAYLHLYASLGLHTVPIAVQRKSISAETSEALLEILSKAIDECRK